MMSVQFNLVKNLQVGLEGAHTDYQQTMKA